MKNRSIILGLVLLCTLGLIASSWADAGDNITVNLISPANGSTVNENTAFNVVANTSGSNGTYNCTVWFNGTAKKNTLGVANKTPTTYVISGGLSEGVWTWKVNCSVNGTYSAPSASRTITALPGKRTTVYSPTYDTASLVPGVVDVVTTIIVGINREGFSLGAIVALLIGLGLIAPPIIAFVAASLMLFKGRLRAPIGGSKPFWQRSD